MYTHLYALTPSYCPTEEGKDRRRVRSSSEDKVWDWRHWSCPETPLVAT